MMPSPLPPPDDRLGVQPAQPGYDQARPPVGMRNYPGEIKGSLETAFYDAVDGVHLTNKQRVEQALSFIYGAIQKLHSEFPNDEALQEELKTIRDEVRQIKMPSPTYSFSVSQGARVLQVSSAKPEGPKDEIAESLAPVVLPLTMDRDYGELFPVIEFVWELAHMLEKRDLMKWRDEEESMADDEFFEGVEIEDREEEHGKR